MFSLCSEYWNPTDISEDSVLNKDLKGHIVSLKPFIATLQVFFIKTLIFLIRNFFSLLKCSLNLWQPTSTLKKNLLFALMKLFFFFGLNKVIMTQNTSGEMCRNFELFSFP